MLAATAGESGHRPAPKEQPPRKLSGKRTAVRSQTLEGGPFAAAPKEQPALSREISQGKDRGGTQLPATEGRRATVIAGGVMAASPDDTLKRTPLYDRHVTAGGRMVAFGG